MKKKDETHKIINMVAKKAEVCLSPPPPPPQKKKNNRVLVFLLYPR